MKELKRYFSHIGKYKWSYWTVFIMTLVTSAGLTIVYPYMNKLIFNALEYGDWEMFRQAVVICIVLVVLNCLAPYRRYFQIRIVRKIVFDIKIKLFAKLMKLDMNYYETHHSGEALKTLNWDANSLKDSYFSHVYWVFGRLVNGVTSILAMYVYSPFLMLVSVGFCLVTVFFSVRINRQIKETDKGIQNKVSRLTARLSDILSGFTELKMFSGASIVCDHFYCENEQVCQDERARAGKAAKLEMVTFLLGILASFGTMGVGVCLVSAGKLDYGTVMAVVSLQMGVSTLVQSFGSALTTLSASLVKAGRVFDFLELDCEEDLEYDTESSEVSTQWQQEAMQQGQEVSAVPKQVAVAPVAVENLTFSYQGEQAVFEDFSLRMKEGEKVMLMGESGCGKSTLLKLLLGFYPQEKGFIRLYGQEISGYSLSALRRLITYIPQRSYLFEGTIRENIAMGCAHKECEEEQIIIAAQMSYAHEFISTLPDGYDTVLEAGGKNLSVGQRQRIAIARAFLKDSPILLMDEPSSALDVHSEKAVNKAIEELMKDKVVLMVTHRNTAEGEFDRVVEI